MSTRVIFYSDALRSLGKGSVAFPLPHVTGLIAVDRRTPGAPTLAAGYKLVCAPIFPVSDHDPCLTFSIAMAQAAGSVPLSRIKQLLASLRESITHKPPFVSGTLQLSPSHFSLFYNTKNDHAAGFVYADAITRSSRTFNFVDVSILRTPPPMS
jgi:hypothetical protein